ncbi:hypothetical protein CARUB_v10002271mg [Capsella rubella]|uniref:Uncharacterized protein n=1 Tax=Capsella rubella TaxID=81985 RepID=R0FBY7_9BRAS|nr:uncharacterized protein LOC17884355 [Capsella rubella]EOA19301.1 hypothetical protein CARUB_v10002271mg [Capsella rubella]
MKTSMSIIVFFVTFIAVSVASMAETINPEEACIRQNIARSQPPSLSAESTERPKFYFLADQFCREASRVVMFYVRLNGKFPSYYVKTLCDVFGNDEKKVKEYVVTRWVGFSKLASALTCVSH